MRQVTLILTILGGMVILTNSEWTCPLSYRANYLCDCGLCGDYDLECDDAKTISRCKKDETCSRTTNTCVSTVVIPEKWTCADSFYNDGFYCDCGCGAPDPDCKPTRGAVFNRQCKVLEVCDPVSDSCVAEGWTCAPELYDSGGDCDCGCGARDPDCDFSSATVSCWVSETTAEYGVYTCSYDECVGLPAGALTALIVVPIVVVLCCCVMAFFAYKSISKKSNSPFSKTLGPPGPQMGMAAVGGIGMAGGVGPGPAVQGVAVQSEPSMPSPIPGQLLSSQQSFGDSMTPTQQFQPQYTNLYGQKPLPPLYPTSTSPHS